jgi:hypothetical protein
MVAAVRRTNVVVVEPPVILRPRARTAAVDPDAGADVADDADADDEHHDDADGDDDLAEADDDAA